jgi:putative selenate reductase
VRLAIEGIDAAGVLDPLDFLFDVRQNCPTLAGTNVVVIGGGNTAMDAARTAYRMVGPGGKVTIVYRRTIREMPADHGEIKAVREEGIRIIELANPVFVRSADGRVTGLVCSRNIMSEKGNDGRPQPVAIPGSEFEIACDTIIPAIGQQLAVDFLEPHQLATLPGSYKTSTPKLYIGGDALRGASTAINAIADGRKAAAEIIRDLTVPPNVLNGFEDRPAHPNRIQSPADLHALLRRKATRAYGVHPGETPGDQRQNFNMVISSLTAEQAGNEASRCLQCDEICNVCVSVCPNLANFGYRIEPVVYTLEKAVLKEDGIIVFEKDKIFRVDQTYQVMNIRDLCNECGNCSTFCPTSGRPFADKPGICLTVNTLNSEGTGFYLSRLADKLVLVYKEQDTIRTLSLENGRYVYETNQVKATIRENDFALLHVSFLTPCVREFHFEFAAEMSVVMRGARQMALNNEQ